MDSAAFGDVVAVILAAGRNKRMKSDWPKAMHKVGGIPMIGMAYNTVKRAGVGRCVAVVGFGAEHIVDYLGDKVEYAYQHEQMGTGHALLTALEHMGDIGGRVLVLYADMPLVSLGTLTTLMGHNAATGEQATLMYAENTDPRGFGRIIRDADGNFQNIIEEKDATQEQLLIRETNPSIYCFDTAAVRAALGKVTKNNAQGEMYLTDVPAIMIGMGGRVGLLKIGDNGECMGANDRAELAELNRALNLAKCNELMIGSGVTVVDRHNTYIDMDVSVGMDTVIYPGCVLEGGTVIGSGCTIGPNTRIRGSVIGDRTVVEYSVLTEARVGDDVSVGPFAYMRPGAQIGDKTKIGDFVEIKNSKVGEDVKISHLAYIGDADVGANTNIGCGVITCNYDGVKKHRTTIGANSFIGSNANLIAPVTVGEHAYVASGSTITDDVPEDALAIARGRQVIKEHWVSSRGLGRG